MGREDAQRLMGQYPDLTVALAEEMAERLELMTRKAGALALQSVRQRLAAFLIKEAEKSLNREISWMIPNDYKTTMTAINLGKPLYEVSPKAAITKSISSLTDSLVGEENKNERKRWKLF